MKWRSADDRITGTDEAHLGLEEIVATCVNFHMERMSPEHLWFALYDEEKGTAQHVDIRADRVSVRPVEPV